MAEDIRMAEIAALVGDPARANILSALMGGRALTAKELAGVAGVSPQTTSGHLGKLFGANLVARVKQGRHRYFRIATPQVAEMLEAIMAVVAATPPRYRPPSKADDAMRMARTCYDHVAGMLGESGEYSELPYFFTDQYELGMEYAGHAPSSNRVVFRGDVDSLEFVAFWLDADNRVLAGMNVNVWDVLDDIKSLIRKKTAVNLSKLVDPQASLGDLIS